MDALGPPETEGHVIEIDGPEVLTYEAMLRATRRSDGWPIIPAAFLTPGLSSLWGGLVTPISSSIARPLIKGLKSELGRRAEQRGAAAEALGAGRLRLALDDAERPRLNPALAGLDLAERLVERHLFEHLGDHLLQPLALLEERLPHGFLDELLEGGAGRGRLRHETGSRGRAGERSYGIRRSQTGPSALPRRQRCSPPQPTTWSRANFSFSFFCPALLKNTVAAIRSPRPSTASTFPSPNAWWKTRTPGTISASPSS